MPIATPRTREPNKRGEGAKLRDAILAAASSILESTGSDDAVTLRAVAREAGITAPAIYAHFADRDAIRFTVIENTFRELARALTEIACEHEDPVDRLRAMCHGYLDFAAERPHHYRVLFERHRAANEPDLIGSAAGATDVRTIVGADAFGVLLGATAACIEVKASNAAAPEATAIRIWIGLHGQATLQASLPLFPWPDRLELADQIMSLLAELA